MCWICENEDAPAIIEGLRAELDEWRTIVDQVKAQRDQDREALEEISAYVSGPHMLGIVRRGLDWDVTPNA